MSIFSICLISNYIVCLLFVIGMVFIEHKKPTRILVWSLAFILIPFVSLFVYVLVGYGLGGKTKRLLKKRQLFNKNYHEMLEKQVHLIKNNKVSDEKIKYKELLTLNLKNAGALTSDDNKVEYYSTGNDFINQLKMDLLNAQKTINIMSYIFANDKTGKEIKNILIEKAKQGVKVNVLYDAIGSFFTRKRNFKELKKYGGEVQEFFPALMGIKLLNFKANYRNHRKIIVIDGKIGYMGGINIRNDHMGLKKRLSPWRDCHIKVEGSAVYSMQNIFISDFRLSSKKCRDEQYYLNENYFPKIEQKGDALMQIISSAPTESYEKNIEDMMIKMIYSAKKSIKIQTPYFILDDSFKMALKMALLSGVKVSIIIPKIPDKNIVYFATFAYIKEVMEMGAKVYLFDGFMHAKTLMVDDEILTVGSCNIDIRSFALNFEVNSVIYGNQNVLPVKNMFDENLKESFELKIEEFQKMSNIKKIGMSLAKIFSQIL